MQLWNGGGGKNNPNATLQPLFPKKKDSPLNMFSLKYLSQVLHISNSFITNKYDYRVKRRPNFGVNRRNSNLKKNKNKIKNKRNREEFESESNNNDNKNHNMNNNINQNQNQNPNKKQRMNPNQNSFRFQSKKHSNFDGMIYQTPYNENNKNHTGSNDNDNDSFHQFFEQFAYRPQQKQKETLYPKLKPINLGRKRIQPIPRKNNNINNIHHNTINNYNDNQSVSSSISSVCYF